MTRAPDADASPSGQEIRARQQRHREDGAIGLDEVLAHIAQVDPTYRAFIRTLPERAARADRARERRRADGRPLPLDGYVVAVKDVVDVEGEVTTAGVDLPGAVPATRNARVVDDLEAKGAVIVGKANMDELALGVTTANPTFGRCINPWNPACVPGGSSGGSAVAVSTGMVRAAVGGDSGGSVRIPASLNGLVGLKPTSGTVATAGVSTSTWSLDVLGPMAPTVAECAALLAGMRGTDLAAATRPAPGPVRVGVPTDFYLDDVDAEVGAAFEVVTRALDRDPRFALVPVATPHAKDAVDAGAVISWSEFAVSREDVVRRHPEVISPTLLRLLLAASTHLAVDYIQAQQLRSVLIDEHDRLWDRIDALAMPTIPVRAPSVADASVIRLASHTRVANLTGEPAVSIPAGRDRLGVPIGVQLLGPRGQDMALLDIASVVEGLLEGWDERW